MFCMSCGTEAMPGASTCARCGASLPRASSTEAIPANTSAALSPVLGAPQPETSYPSLAVPGHHAVHRISRNAVLLIVLALGTDMLAPWLGIQGGVTATAAESGFPVILALCVLAVAALSAVLPSARKHPAVAMIPLAAGGFCIGAVATLTTRLTALTVPATSSPFVATQQPVPVVPEMGLYLFLVGSLLLLVAGYGMLIADV